MIIIPRSSIFITSKSTVCPGRQKDNSKWTCLFKLLTRKKTKKSHWLTWAVLLWNLNFLSYHMFGSFSVPWKSSFFGCTTFAERAYFSQSVSSVLWRNVFNDFNFIHRVINTEKKNRPKFLSDSIILGRLTAPFGRFDHEWPQHEGHNFGSEIILSQFY